MKHALFADSIFNFAVVSNLVRIDLGVAEVVQVNAEGKQETRLVISQQIVMPMDGFVRAVGMQDQIAHQLVKSGAVKIQPKEGVQSSHATGTLS